MKVVLRVAAAACIVAAATSGFAGMAGGQEADETSTEEVTLPQAYLVQYGWWNKAQQAPGGGAAVPAPPTAPSDGIYIAYDYQAATAPVPGAVTAPIGLAPAPPAPAPSAQQELGPTAFGAVKFSVPAGAEGQLSLRLLNRASTTPGNVDPSAGTMLACLAVSPWDGLQNGRYDNAPKYDCNQAAVAQLAGDTLLFDLTPGLITAETYDLVLVPAGAQPFNMSLDRPSDASLVITSAPETEDFGEFTSEDFAFEDPLTMFDDSFATIDDTTFADGGFASDFATDAVAPTAGGRRSGGIAAPVAIHSPFSPDATRGERLLAVALLLMMGGALWWLGGKPTRAPRLLGSLGARSGAGDVAEQAVAMGGIGRFARPRPAGGPPRLF